MSRLSVVFLISVLTLKVFSQNIPEGYILQYQQDFSDVKCINDFRFTYPQNWSIKSESKNKYLHINSEDHDSVGRQESIALIENFIFGDFIFEADVMLVGEQNNIGNVFFNIGIRDSIHFYSIILNSLINDNKPDIIITNELPGNSVADSNVIKKELGNKGWHKIRIERNIVNRTIQFYLDDMKTPVVVSRDRTFVMGYIGFGSVYNDCKIDNIKIWSQTAIPEPASFYIKKI